MGLKSLLVCTDAKTVQTLTGVLLDAVMDVELCGDPSIAYQCLSTQHFDAIFVDCQNEGATNLLSQIRSDPAHRDAVAIAILESGTNAPEVFAKGAAYVLYKPISEDGTNHKAAPTSTRTERRLTPRIPVETNASIAYASTENDVIRVLDLSVNGIAIYSPKPLPRDCKVYFQFSLPGEAATIRLSCEVIWQHDSGNVGMRFADVPKASRRLLEYWIQNKVGGELQVAHSPADEPSSDLRQRLVAQLGLIAVPPSERRHQTRHQCALGAQVSRAGSAVQQRCVISDISSGGCYVQTSEPLPVGTSVEVAIRTQELNLKILGNVQIVHRGLGMGVQFESRKSPEQLEQLISELESQVSV
jgi:CheY-like chemotaxis protein